MAAGSLLSHSRMLWMPQERGVGLGKRVTGIYLHCYLAFCTRHQMSWSSTRYEDMTAFIYINDLPYDHLISILYPIESRLFR